MPQPEHLVQDAIMNYLSVVEQLDPTAFFARTNTGSFRIVPFGVATVEDTRKLTVMRTGRPGWPDVSGIFQGRPVFIEVKTDSGRLSEDQEKVHARLRQGGALVIVARSAKDVEEHLIPRKDLTRDGEDTIPF